MVIKRSGLESTDFPDIETGKQIAPVHPGEILRVELLDPPGMPVNALAKALRVPTPRINDVVLGKRAIPADTALRPGRYFGASAQFWLNLQTGYDLRIATGVAGGRIASEIEPLARAAPETAHHAARPLARSPSPQAWSACVATVKPRRTA